MTSEINDKKIVPKKVNDYTYIVEKSGKMNVPVKIFASEKLMEKSAESAISIIEKHEGIGEFAKESKK